ncbi:PEP-CTERM-box response regulator transcription factor [Desulfovibrio oxyclinae]|jgi:two-component system NtrC family response regulator|uniref:PEP-CTERM-box response regulator transcription factor n=1 Tax=Desulfovibrio oxyclinae TaxID=63560 RepID=UPI000377EFE6|nr:PEP-CTERM-box response regulator transcription factor [Desulfovibrio oxyclinae]
MQKLLIIDDNDEVRRQLKWGLSKGGYELTFARDGVEGLNMFKKQEPSVVTLDLGLPPHENGVEEGLRCLGEMLRINPLSKIIVITGNEEHGAALKAVQGGAYDYYKKPIDLNELKIIIDRAMYLQTLEQENQDLRDSSVADCGIVGECGTMQEVFTLIDRVAASDVPVLITGESGTGKELVARAIHAKGPRADKDMVCINCGAIPENLLESELFGHEKGAFTGANRTVKGKVEYAEKGTLFLDEIGEMPMSLQVKLLRFLQEMVITRVGGRRDIEVDVRIIAATNVDIQEAMQNGTFREDLFYRIGVVNIVLPPLRDRGADIALLANYFLKRVSAGAGSRGKAFSPEALEYINGYDWPGNIRELENRVKRAVIMATGPQIEPDDLGINGGDVLRQRLHANDLSLKEARMLLERDMVEDALKRESGNIVKAAASIGVSRPTFYDLMKKHGVRNA